MKKHYFVFVSILLLALSIPLAVYVSQKRQEYRQHAAGTSPYPANIEYNNGGYGVYSQAALTNQNIGGIDVTMDWSKVEPQQGVFNWTPLDNELQAWGSVGKKLVIIIRYVGETSGNTGTGTGCPTTGLLPSWEAARIPTFCDSDKVQIIPDYFNPIFQSDLKAYVTAIADHIAASPYKNNIIFVRAGLGEGGEAFPLSGCVGACSQTDYQADIQQLQTWGFTPQNWVAWQESMLSFEKSTFPWTTVVYGATTAFTPQINPLNTNPATGNYTDFDVAIYAASHGIGVGQQGLYNGAYKPGSSSQEIFSYISQHYPNTFLQFAAWGLMSKTAPCITNPTTACEVGIVQNEIQALEQYGARTMDWWYDDDVNPAFQPYFAQWQQYVDSTYGGVGTPSPTQPIQTSTPSPIQLLTPTPSPTPSQYQVKFQKNISYGPNASETADICTPIGAISAEPGILMIHGGGWSQGDKNGYDTLCQNYAAQGYVAATIDYRLTSSIPSSQWPDQIGDVQLAVRWLRQQAQSLGLDPMRICSLGDSAGGHLALLLDTMQTIYSSDVSSFLPTYSPHVQCVVDQFGPSDLAKLYNENTGSQSNYVRTSIQNLLDNQTPQSNSTIYANASPVTYISSQTGSALIIQGTQDQVVLPDQSTELQQLLQSANIPVQYISYTGGHEYKSIIPPPSKQDIYNKINAWLLTVLGPQPTGSPFPTTSPTLAPSLTPPPTPTILPSVTPTIPPGHTSFAITLCPHGLGNCGDNVNSTGGNTNPIHKIRTILVSVFDTSNNPVGQVIHSTLSYSSTTQNFQDVIDMGTLASGQYLVTIKMDGFLTKQIPGIVTVTKGQQVTLPSVSLVTGDITNDNKVDIQDYNALVSCYGTKVTLSSCLYPPTSTSPGADILDDGPGSSDPNKNDPPVDGGDYNEFLRELSVQIGQ